MTSSLDNILGYGELEEWRRVPGLVRERYKEAADIKYKIRRIAKYLPVADPGYGQLWWNPETKTVWASLSDSDSEQTHQRWHNALKGITGVQNVRTEAEYGPHDDPDWIRIKRAAALAPIYKPYEVATNALGGSSPLSNMLVGGLLTGGLGYGAGALLEHLFPERFVERGRLRKTMGLAGAGIGAMPGAMQAYVNKVNSQEAAAPYPKDPAGDADLLQPLGWSSLWTPNKDVPLNKKILEYREQLQGKGLPPREGSKQAALSELREGLAGLDQPDSMFLKAAAEYSSSGASVTPGNRGVLRPIPVDAFNRVIWNDVHNARSARNNPYGTRSAWGSRDDPMHTPPVVAAATTGLVSGIQAQYGNPSLLSPRHFIRGLMAAGIDTATARVAGGTLGVLGGLTPSAQTKLQDIGLWGGMIRGIAGSVLGL